MNEKTGFEIMDSALFILTHAIEINIDLQELIIDLSKKISSAAVIFKKVRPIWQYQKDLENVFWDKYNLFSKTSVNDLNLFLKVKDFQRFYSRVLQKILFKLAFHSVNAKPLIFTSNNLLDLINLAIIKKQTVQIESLNQYINIVKYILQQNIAFQKLILELMNDQNYITSLEMKKFQRFTTGEENLQFLNIISPFIEEYCNRSKERIFGYTTEKWQIPEQFLKMMYSGTPEHFIYYLEDSIKKEVSTEMNTEQTYIYNKFMTHHKYAESHLEHQGEIIIKKQTNGEQTNKNKIIIGNYDRNKKFRKRESVLGKQNNRKSSLGNKMKCKTEYKKKSSILHDKQMSILQDLQQTESNSLIRVSTIKSRQSILNSLHSFVDQYPTNDQNSNPSESSNPQTKTVIIQEQPLIQLLKLSHQNSKSSIQMPLGFGLGDTNNNLKKAKLNNDEKSNMFNKLKYMKAIGQTLIPNERRSIKTISKLINYQKERIPSYQQTDNNLRQSLMNKILDLIGNKAKLNERRQNKDYSLQDFSNHNRSYKQNSNQKMNQTIQVQSKSRKSRFASKQDQMDRLKTQIVQGQQQKSKFSKYNRNSRSISVRDNLNFYPINFKPRQRSISITNAGKKYDVYDTRIRQIVH